MSSFSSFLAARLEGVGRRDGHIHDPPSPPLDSHAFVAASPAKRPRSDSPDVSGASSPTAVAPALFGILSSSPETSPASSCFLAASIRSILCPSSSPVPSRSSSRRSSSGCSSSKHVRFQRCTNASVFPALSSSEYDRTPIEPTCEAESLNMPKRDNEGTEGWIKCVERARVAEKERKAAAAAAIAAGESPAPYRLTTTSHKVVEGVHGLVGGGYFVGGEERDVLSVAPVSSDSESDCGAAGDAAQDDANDHVDDDAMVVDDEEDGGESDHQPALTTDDSSSDAESLPSVPGVEPPIRVHVVVPFAAVGETSAAPVPAAAVAAVTVCEAGKVDTTTAAVAAAVSAPEDAAASSTAAAAEAERKRKCKERYGICALGKYSRAEVFQSYDSLGGF